MWPATRITSASARASSVAFDVLRSRCSKRRERRSCFYLRLRLLGQRSLLGLALFNHCTRTRHDLIRYQIIPKPRNLSLFLEQKQSLPAALARALEDNVPRKLLHHRINHKIG